VAEVVDIGGGKPALIRNPWAVVGLIVASAVIGIVIGFLILASILSASGESAGILAFLVISPLIGSVAVLGIYGIFWLYWVLTELRDFGIARSDKRLSKIRPWLPLVLVLLTGGIGAIVILPLLMHRVLHAQELAGVKRSSVLLLVALLVGGLFLYLPLFAFYGVLQDGLNRVWRSLSETVIPAVSPAPSPA
jgi:hypothetical protein